MTAALLLAVCFLAYANGANDNFKGVATLLGSGTTDYRAAIGWATISTFAGSLAGILLTRVLFSRFSGEGLVPDALTASQPFLLAVALGAGVTVMTATLAGLPVSTTHALTGALVGSGWMAAGSQINLAVLGRVFLLPLLLSPLLAVGFAGSLYLALRWLRLKLGITKEWCLCVGEERQIVPMPQPISVMACQVPPPTVSLCVDERILCTERYPGRLWGMGLQVVVDAAHLVSAGVVGFARGLNDTPKMAALLLALPAWRAHEAMAAIAVLIAAGGLSARRVADTMSYKITDMNHGQGFSANLATGVLVIVASIAGLPVSTTHVSVGSLFGIGAATGQADRAVIRQILVSWLLTLPFAAVIGGLAYVLVG